MQKPENTPVVREAVYRKALEKQIKKTIELLSFRASPDSVGDEKSSF